MQTIIQVILITVILTACTARLENIKGKVSESRPEGVMVPTDKPIKQPDSPAKPYTEPNAQAERNKIIARRFYDEVVNSHNMGMIDSFASPDYAEHQYDVHFAGNLKGMKKSFAYYFAAFPDIHVKVNFMMAEGDLVTVQITTTGTNTGPLYGKPGTGKKFVINGVDIIRFKNGKAIEHWGYAEEGKMLKQLGLIGPLLKAGRKNRGESAKSE